MHDGSFEEFFQNRQSVTLESMSVKEGNKLVELINEQEEITQAILKRMLPDDENRELLQGLETTLILISEVLQQRMYLQGLYDGMRSA